MLIKYVQSEDCIAKRKGKTITSTFLTYRCLKAGCVDLTFEKGFGFQNPYRHLKSSYRRGKPHCEQDEIVQTMFRESLKKSRAIRGSIPSQCESNAPSKYEKTMYGFLRLTVMRNQPLKAIEGDEFRSFGRHKVPI